MRHIPSRLGMAGHNEGISAALLRHSSTALVKRYDHLSPLHLYAAAVEIVAAFSAGANPPRRVNSKRIVTDTGTVGSVGEGNGVEVAENLVSPTRIERATNGLGISKRKVAQVLDDLGNLLYPCMDQAA